MKKLNKNELTKITNSLISQFRCNEEIYPEFESVNVGQQLIIINLAMGSWEEHAKLDELLKEYLFKYYNYKIRVAQEILEEDIDSTCYTANHITQLLREV